MRKCLKSRKKSIGILLGHRSIISYLGRRASFPEQWLKFNTGKTDEKKKSYRFILFTLVCLFFSGRVNNDLGIFSDMHSYASACIPIRMFRELLHGFSLPSFC